VCVCVCVCGLQLESLVVYLVVKISHSMNGAAILENRKIILFITVTLEVLGSLDGHLDTVNDICFSKDGMYLASASADGTARIWDVSTQTEVINFDHGTCCVLGVAFTSTGDRLATKSENTGMVIWCTRSRDKLVEFPAFHYSVSNLYFTANDQHLVSSDSEEEKDHPYGRDSNCCIWDAATGTELKRLYSYSGRVYNVAVSPDEKWIAASGGDHCEAGLQVWSADTGETVFASVDIAVQLAFNSTGSMLVATWNEAINIWDTSTWSILKTIEGDNYGCYSVFELSSDTAVITCEGTDIKVIDVSTGEDIQSLSTESRVLRICCSQSTNILL
jgi:WD40 repeat protein